MDLLQVCDILESLADGVNPLTGTALPDESPYHNPTVLRALYQALCEMRCVTLVVRDGKQARRTGDRQRPGNAGNPWSRGEERRLLRDFDAGSSLDELAEKHQRTQLAIQARLIRLDKLAPLDHNRA
jgi:hypothetical protein